MKKKSSLHVFILLFGFVFGVVIYVLLQDFKSDDSKYNYIVQNLIESKDKGAQMEVVAIKNQLDKLQITHSQGSDLSPRRKLKISFWVSKSSLTNKSDIAKIVKTTLSPFIPNSKNWINPNLFENIEIEFLNLESTVKLSNHPKENLLNLYRVNPVQMNREIDKFIRNFNATWVSGIGSNIDLTNFFSKSLDSKTDLELRIACFDGNWCWSDLNGSKKTAIPNGFTDGSFVNAKLNFGNNSNDNIFYSFPWIHTGKKDSVRIDQSLTSKLKVYWENLIKDSTNINSSNFWVSEKDEFDADISPFNAEVANLYKRNLPIKEKLEFDFKIPIVMFMYVLIVLFAYFKLKGR
jgi:hypothetical protein